MHAAGAASETRTGPVRGGSHDARDLGGCICGVMALTIQNVLVPKGKEESQYLLVVGTAPISRIHERVDRLRDCCCDRRGVRPELLALSQAPCKDLGAPPVDGVGCALA